MNTGGRVLRCARVKSELPGNFGQMLGPFHTVGSVVSVAQSCGRFVRMGLRYREVVSLLSVIQEISHIFEPWWPSSVR